MLENVRTQGFKDDLAEVVYIHIPTKLVNSPSCAEELYRSYLGNSNIEYPPSFWQKGRDSSAVSFQYQFGESPALLGVWVSILQCDKDLRNGDVEVYSQLQLLGSTSGCNEIDPLFGIYGEEL